MWHMYDGYHFWGMHLIWWIAWIIFLVWIFAMPSAFSGKKREKETPLDILKKRYARGEITKEEFEEKKETLGY